MMFLSALWIFRGKKHAHPPSKTPNSKTGYKRWLMGSSHLKINVFPPWTACLTSFLLGLNLLLESNMAAHSLRVSSSFAMGPISKGSKHTPFQEGCTLVRCCCETEDHNTLSHQTGARSKWRRLFIKVCGWDPQPEGFRGILKKQTKLCTQLW